MNEKLQSILEAEQLSVLLGKFSEQGVTDSILGDLTDSDLKELGIDKLGERKRLLAAFGTSVGGSTAEFSVVEEQTVSTGARSRSAATPAEATKESPWVNTLGMPFVPIPRFETRFCIWPVRVQDYEVYCRSTGAKFPDIPFSQGADHPIVGVTWQEAIEFCVWLTVEEHKNRRIQENVVYRLPTDLEWSAAVGLPHEPEPTPMERHLKAQGYPWGLRWPPPRDVGNYEHDRIDQLRMKSSYEAMRSDANSPMPDGFPFANYYDPDRLRRDAYRLEAEHRAWLRDWSPIDGHEFTSPVESFHSNENGIYDLGGNVWEWCMDAGPDLLHAVLRGGSYSIYPDEGEAGTSGDGWGWEKHVNKTNYKSSFRLFWQRGSAVQSKVLRYPSEERDEVHPASGFRIVIETSSPNR
jgi:formylglycine-generating enzyme required for sulfatase activity